MAFFGYLHFARTDHEGLGCKSAWSSFCLLIVVAAVAEFDANHSLAFLEALIGQNLSHA